MKETIKFPGRMQGSPKKKQRRKFRAADYQGIVQEAYGKINPEIESMEVVPFGRGPGKLRYSEDMPEESKEFFYQPTISNISIEPKKEIRPEYKMERQRYAEIREMLRERQIKDKGDKLKEYKNNGRPQKFVSIFLKREAQRQGLPLTKNTGRVNAKNKPVLKPLSLREIASELRPYLINNPDRLSELGAELLKDLVTSYSNQQQRVQSVGAKRWTDFLTRYVAAHSLDGPEFQGLSRKEANKKRMRMAGAQFRREREYIYGQLG